MIVCLVHLGISRCGWNSYGTSQESSYISHGLAILSAICKRAGHEVHLIDLRRLRGWWDFRQELRWLKPEMVGISAMTVDMDYCIRAVKEIRKVAPRVRVVIGGVHASIAPDDVVAKTGVDCVVIGEGEVVFPQMLADLSDHKYVERFVNGLGTVADLDTLPFADRSVYPAPEFPVHPSFPAPMVSVIAGRGCIYNCSFCQPTERLVFGRGVRRRSVENVIAELKTLHFGSLMIHDDCLTEDAAWVEEFCEAYQSAGFKQPWSCQSRADIIVKNPMLFGRMRWAGLKMLSIGFESGNDRILKLLRKGVTVEQNYEAARVCRDFGIMIGANYMIGMPTETPEEMQDTAKMIRLIEPEINSVAWFTPQIGSDLYDYCIKHGLLIDTSYSGTRRNRFVPKVRGIDYSAVRRAMWQARGGWTLRQWVSDHPFLYKAYKRLQ